MTLCSVCGQIVSATVPCYDGARRCLPCAAAGGFAWRPNDLIPADLDRDARTGADDPPPIRWRPRGRAHLTLPPPHPRR